MYFIISNSNGDTLITAVTKTELLEELEDRDVEFLTKKNWTMTGTQIIGEKMFYSLLKVK